MRLWWAWRHAPAVPALEKARAKTALGYRARSCLNKTRPTAHNETKADKQIKKGENNGKEREEKKEKERREKRRRLRD